MSPAEMESDKVVQAEVEEAAADPEQRTASGGGDPKACDDCNTTKTPLWRGGPNGPKSLCNACGIRYRKRRRVAMGLDPEAKRKPKRDDAIKAAAEAAEASTTKEEEEDKAKAGDDTKAGEEKATKKTKTTTHTVELHMVGFSKDAVLKQQRRRRQMRRRKPSCLGEEERAAILLMSLSSGVIYA